MRRGDGSEAPTEQLRAEAQDYLNAAAASIINFALIRPAPHLH
jgi:hypothetical protein